MLEAGSIRSKNVTNILIKNFADLCMGVCTFLLVGYGLAFGSGSEWLGQEYFGLYTLPVALLPHAFMQVGVGSCVGLVSPTPVGPVSPTPVGPEVTYTCWSKEGKGLYVQPCAMGLRYHLS